MDHPKVPTHRPNISRSLEGLDQIGSELSDFLNQYESGESKPSAPPKVPSTRPNPKSTPNQEGFSFPAKGPHIPSHRPIRSSATASSSVDSDAISAANAPETPELPAKRPQRELKPSSEIQESEYSSTPVVPLRRPIQKKSTILSESDDIFPNASSAIPVLSSIHSDSLVDLNESEESSTSIAALPHVPTTRPKKTVDHREQILVEKEDSLKLAPVIPSTRPRKKSPKIENISPDVEFGPESETSVANPSQILDTESSISDLTQHDSDIVSYEAPIAKEVSTSKVEVQSAPKLPSSRPKKKIISSPKIESQVENEDEEDILEEYTSIGTEKKEKDDVVESKSKSLVNDGEPKTVEVEEAFPEAKEMKDENTALPDVPFKSSQQDYIPINTEEPPKTTEKHEPEIDSSVSESSPKIPLSRPIKKKADSIEQETEPRRKSTMSDLFDVYQSESLTSEVLPDVIGTESKLQEPEKKLDLESSKEEQEEILEHSKEDLSKPESKEVLHKKAPPKVPKKPSSRIAQFQQRLAQQQQQDLAFMKPKLQPVRPVKRSSSTSTDTSDSKDLNDDIDSTNDNIPSTTHSSHPKYVGRLNTDFAKNLNGMLGKSIPGMGGIPLPGMTMPGIGFGGVPPQINDEESIRSDDEDKEKKEETKVGDVRKGRAKGPRGRKLPGKVKEKILVDDKSLGVEDDSKLSTFVVGNAWSIKVSPQTLGNGKTEDSVDSSKEISTISSEDDNSVVECEKNVTPNSKNSDTIDDDDDDDDNDKVIDQITKPEVELSSSTDSSHKSSEDHEDDKFIEIEKSDLENERGPIEPDNSFKELEDSEENHIVSLKPELSSSIEKSTNSSRYEDADDYLSLEEDFESFEDAEEHVKSTPKSNTPKKVGGARDILSFSTLNKAE